LSLEAVHNWIKKRGKRFTDDQEVEMAVEKWLRQQSTNSYAAGYDAFVMRLDKCINVGGGCVEK
jgi:hypothetical protein